MAKKILYITFHRLTDNNGGANASKGFIKCFATLFDDCSIIYPHFEGDTSPYIPSKYRLFPMHDNRSKIRKFFDMYRGVISGLYYHIKEHLKTNHYDIVVIDHSFTGAGVSKYIRQTGAKVITIHHNVERDYLRDNSKERPLFYRFPFLYFSKRAERECLRNSNLNLTVTKRDATEFLKWHSNICVYNWGIFEYIPIKNKTFTQKSNEKKFVITGSLCFRQSLLPIVNFIQRYWPLVVNLYPNAQLIITGRNPSQHLKKICNHAHNIMIIPNPEDIASVVGECNYYICPINAGSGLKLRILDGLKQGIPILCHEVSSAGYEDFITNHILYTYSDTQTFIDSLNMMLSTNISPDIIFQAFKKQFSIESGISLLQEILTQENFF